MSPTTTPNRCRIVLIAPPGGALADFDRRLADAFSGGDVASILLPAYDQDDAAFQAFAERVVPVAQDKGVAAVIAGDSRIAGRVHADGIHIDGKKAQLAEMIDRMQDKMMVGAGGAKTRDDALELGELRPDYLFFGRFGYDNTPAPHPRNLSLGRWWAEMIQIPCIVLGGTTIESVEPVAATGVEFVALSSAVFADGADAAAAVARANELLDQTAPRFEG
jgi:thiamine-phosphate pyrophosphorylase